MTNDDIEAAVMKWRQERSERLRTDEKSWFGLAGLFWLKDGENSFGNDPSCDFVLPAGTPKRVGTFDFHNDQVTVKAAPGVKITCNEGPLPNRPLLDDQQENPDFLRFGNFIVVVIKRGTSTLIRLWDVNSAERKNFSGLNFFPYKPEFRITAKYTGYAPYKIARTEDIIGEVHDTQMLGYATFEWEGKQYRLDAEDGGDGLFIAFKDKTNAGTTYAGGRYLMTERPQNGQVVLEFNKAYNMPCAYVLFATCGLPTKDNRLPFSVEAGEKKYKDDH